MSLLARGAAATTLVAVFCLAATAASPVNTARPRNEVGNPAVDVAQQWNNAAVVALQSSHTPPTVAARILAIAHAAMYDAWASYDPVAAGSIPGAPARQPQSQNTPLNKASAVTYAAYRTLVNLIPSQTAAFNTLMGPNNLAYDPSITTTSLATPPGVGNAAAAAQLAFRQNDGSNQLGSQPGSVGGPYSDYTGYQPVNSPTTITDPNHWQPLQPADSTPQTFLTPFWGLVTPFALTSASQFRPAPPPQNGNWLYQQRIRDVIERNTELADRSKMSAQFWADPTGSTTAVEQWNLIAEAISDRDQHTLDQDVTMFFALNSAELDVSIGVWDAKRFYDFIRPVSAIHYFYTGQTLQGYIGPGEAGISISGAAWVPWIATPPYPEYPSDTSAFATAGAEILKLFTGDDVYVTQVAFNAGSSTVDPGNSPVNATTLGWFTFSQIAESAEWSGGPAGTQFADAELQGGVMGRAIADVAWNRYSKLIVGSH